MYFFKKISENDFFKTCLVETLAEGGTEAEEDKTLAADLCNRVDWFSLFSDFRNGSIAANQVYFL